MNKDIAKELDIECKEVARRFSNANREGNFNKETFEVEEIIQCQTIPLRLFLKRILAN